MRAKKTTATEKPTVKRQAYVEDMQKAREGDQEALARFLNWLETTTKTGPRLGEFLSTLTFDAENPLLQLMFGKNDLLFQELQRRKMQQQRKELGAETGTPLERLLIDRVVLCGLQLQCYEMTVANNDGTLSMRQHEFHQKRLEQVSRRYLAAIKTLAQVRRLQLPAVQVNIGEKQINLVQGGTQTNIGPSSPSLSTSQNALPTLTVELEAPTDELE